MKKVNLKWLGIVVVILICIPVLMDWIIIGNCIKSNISNPDWVSFLGSYLGSILGVVGVFLVTKMDQREREKERKDSLFLNNISIYGDILNFLNTSRLSSIQKEIIELKSKNYWNTIDSLTRQKLNKIEMDLYYANENMGLLNTIKNFIRLNLSDELEETMFMYDEFDDYLGYRDIPEQVLDSVAVIIANNLEIDLLHKNSVYMKISKVDMKKKLEDNKYTKGYTDEKIAEIYKKTSKIGSSDEWKKYMRKRSEVFNKILKLREHIDLRMEKALTY